MTPRPDSGTPLRRRNLARGGTCSGYLPARCGRRRGGLARRDRLRRGSCPAARHGADARWRLSGLPRSARGVRPHPAGRRDARHLGGGLSAAGLPVGACLSGTPRATSAGAYPRLDAPAALAFPGPEAMESARRYLELRKARVSFAVADTRGAIAGFDTRRRYRAASLVKAMVMVAFLNRLDRPPTSDERERLQQMVRFSDNDAAIELHRTGRAARRCSRSRGARGMRDFSDTGSWSESTVTAADQARLFAKLDRLVAPPAPGVRAQPAAVDRRSPRAGESPGSRGRSGVCCSREGGDRPATAASSTRRRGWSAARARSPWRC